MRKPLLFFVMKRMLVPNLDQTKKPDLQAENLALKENFPFPLFQLSSENRKCNMYIYKTSNCWIPYFHTVLELDDALFSIGNIIIKDY